MAAAGGAAAGTGAAAGGAAAGVPVAGAVSSDADMTRGKSGRFGGVAQRRVCGAREADEEVGWDAASGPDAGGGGGTNGAEVESSRGGEVFGWRRGSYGGRGGEVGGEK